MTTSRGSLPCAAGPTTVKESSASSRLVLAQVLDAAGLADRVDLRLPRRRRLVAGAGTGVVVGVGDQAQHLHRLVEDRRGLQVVAVHPRREHVEHPLAPPSS